MDKAGNVLLFEYVYMHDGSLTAIDIDHVTVERIVVNGISGQFFKDENPEHSNVITWTDKENKYQFFIWGCFDKEEMLSMAQSVR